MRVAAMVVLTGLVLGCPGLQPYGRVVRYADADMYGRSAIYRASAELDCGREDLAVMRLGAGGYRVRGCQLVATYTCMVARGHLGEGSRVMCARDGEIHSTTR